ncbi:MAG: helix-turn-helix transcriptional regulator [Planctomycetota bacterium]
MKLADWLHARSLTPEQLRRMLGVTSRSTVNRYLGGDRVPRPPILHQIHDLTGGAVTLEDFLDPTPPECAAVVRDVGGRTRWVFPWSRGYAQERAFIEMMRSPREGDTPSEPLTMAMETLGSRLRRTRRGRFLLDGRPSDARRVVAAANRIRAASGEPPIPYPTVRRRDDDR